MLEAILEIILTPILEPTEKWITRITNNKTQKYNKLLRSMIKVIVYTLCMAVFLGLLTVIIISYLQRADLITPVFSAAFVNIFLIINTLFLASAMLLSIFHTKIKKQKYVVIPVSIIVFICNIVFLINT